MNITQDKKVVWYIVFTDSDTKYWPLYFLGKGFRHVYAFKRSEGGAFWIVVDPVFAFTDVKLIPISIAPEPETLLDTGDRLLRVETDIDRNKTRWSLCVINCVEIVKSLIGMRSFWTITPYQLYKKLRKQNG